MPEPREPISLPTQGRLYLIIKTIHIGVYPQPPTRFAANGDAQVFQAYTATSRDPNTTTPSSVTYLLEGEVSDFCCFSRHENTQWLIDIAHDLCDPLHRRGILWIVSSQYPIPAHSGDPLYAATYEYQVLQGNVLQITKESPLRGDPSFSETSHSGGPRNSTSVKNQDGVCWVTHTSRPLKRSNIIPVRVGDAQARYIYQIFTNMANPPFAHGVQNPQFGIFLNTKFNYWFDQFHVGFRQTVNNHYYVHNFMNPGVPSTGTWPTAAHMIPPFLDGRLVSPPNPTSPDNPPPGLFRWHYLQCVIKRFGAAGYDNIEHIAMYENPPLREGDPENDQDGPDSDEGNNSGQWSLVGGHVGRAVVAIEPELERFAVTAPQLVTA
ncbi:hypothetical protein FB446DRAFT_681166 [Lentinula raphanica]|nr:hypothetical protein FB446DRAFT_681166 [Lentinula raphanica]